MASDGGVVETRVGGFGTTGPRRGATGTASGPHRGATGITAPVLARFTQGLHVDRSMLDDYLMYVPDPPAVGDAAGTAYRLSRPSA
ncbi:hypothetical protein [Salinispora sp. H7-4]|uniref:hypothetical protein n=1 Tax=Salinispora sp. H7-4 TaxID=2748321 RepID=UPI0003696513|nr:hypothetical protein [Salinispora sp. H7-4]NYT93336.1 hypothetical protein [Salinispora sp. H7-4]